MKILSPGQDKAEETLNACLRQIVTHQNLNAFVSLDAERSQVCAQAIDKNPRKGKLAGMVIAVKDNIHVKDLPNSAGTPALVNFVPQEDAPIVAALRAAGAIIIGKTNMHELAYGITSVNAHFGSVKNAYNTDYMAGGSSGGSAVAVAKSMASAALGTDTVGSIRIPSALNGICGLRPSWGRYSQEGLTPLIKAKDTIGPMAKNIDDLALLDAVITSEKIPLSKLDLKQVRLGVPTSHFTDYLSNDVKKVFNALLYKLEKAGVGLVPVGVEGLVDLMDKMGSVILYRTESDLSAYLAQYSTKVTVEDLIARIASPDVRIRYANSVLPQKTLKEEFYTQVMQETQEKLRLFYQCLFAKHEIAALIFPTTQGGSIRFEKIHEPDTGKFFRLNANPGSCAGLPCLSLPMGMGSEGLPLGVELDGLPKSDRHLLALGKAIEDWVAV